jgi:hypothetical protein
MERVEVSEKALRILVVISRPLARLVPVEHGGQQFEAVSPCAGGWSTDR